MSIEWIDTKDEQPPYHVDIMFYCGELNGIRFGRFYRFSHKYISEGDFFYGKDVTHWMPLPEPPIK